MCPYFPTWILENQKKVSQEDSSYLSEDNCLKTNHVNKKMFFLSRTTIKTASNKIQVPWPLSRERIMTPRFAPSLSSSTSRRNLLYIASYPFSILLSLSLIAIFNLFHSFSSTLLLFSHGAITWSHWNLWWYSACRSSFIWQSLSQLEWCNFLCQRWRFVKSWQHIPVITNVDGHQLKRILQMQRGSTLNSCDKLEENLNIMTTWQLRCNLIPNAMLPLVSLQGEVCSLVVSLMQTKVSLMAPRIPAPCPIMGCLPNMWTLRDTKRCGQDARSYDTN